ncbi:DUF6522 family protein [Fodinicurvata sp. EGI_FJ10296]|uniref:DUF6522 family protein n=1 Tax=Fodinicurvata sp. EGI_FJ10296 TaxID=3231908 RepID=UPI003451DE8C
MAMTTEDRKDNASPVTRAPDGSFTVDATYIAPKLGLEPDRFMALLRDGRVFQATERGTGSDAGTWRLTFTWASHRWQIVVDDIGQLLTEGPLS